MASVLDVAEYILEQRGPMTAMKLQKLVYYAQAWSLVWDEKPLFSEKIEAWANGPVVRELWQAHRGQFQVGTVLGNSACLGPVERETIDAVLNSYAGKSSQWLSELTHLEDPWRDARREVPDGSRAAVEIRPAAMAEYYSGL